MPHSIYILECLFHMNEVYFTHVICLLEGKKKGPGMLQDCPLLNDEIKDIVRAIISNIPSRHSLPTIPILKITAMHFES